MTELENFHTQALTHSYMTSKDAAFDYADWKAKPWEAVSNPISSGKSLISLFIHFLTSN